jgi:hypothetical protein
MKKRNEIKASFHTYISAFFFFVTKKFTQGAGGAVSLKRDGGKWVVTWYE